MFWDIPTFTVLEGKSIRRAINKGRGGGFWELCKSQEINVLGRTKGFLVSLVQLKETNENLEESAALSHGEVIKTLIRDLNGDCSGPRKRLESEECRRQF